MATRIPAQEEKIFLPSFEMLAEEIWQKPGRRMDPLAIVLVGLLIFLAVQLFLDSRRQENLENQITEPASLVRSQSSGQIISQSSTGNSGTQISPSDPSLITFPYDDYWVTQGPHGMSYGHMAIDIAAGKGAAIKSPIAGVVTANYIDVYGNTTLVIENDSYQITLLHGDFSVTNGQELSIGEVIGAENNNGYTTDMQGRSCRGRDCGHHTHLNVYDKIAGQNINPLDILVRPGFNF